MPKGRPRYTRTGRAYTPKRTRDWEQLAAKLLYQSSLGFQASPDDGPIGVELTFIHKRPKRLCRKSDPDGRLWRPIKGRGGDIDNQIKSILDACQAGRIIEDDAQVVELWARDLWGAKDEDGCIHILMYAISDLG